MNQEHQLPRRVALVTGGSRGIGLGIAERLAEEGCDLAINGVRDESAVSEVIARLGEKGAEVLYCRGDVATSADRAAIIDSVKRKFGRLDVLVNNAGITSPGRKDILDADESGFDTVIGVNLKGPFFLTQLAARWMIEQRQADERFTGCIVNISSISADLASIHRGDYCLTKAAIGMATKLWAVRLAAFDISVFEIRPGIIETDMTALVKAKYDKLIAEGLTLEPRWGTPTDVGRAVAMLVRGDLSYATGQVLTLDGGLCIPRL